MRKTLTIGDDLIQALKDLAHQRGISFKEVVNDTPRRGLSAGEEPGAAAEPFRVLSAPRGFRPGIDPMTLNQLADKLETERFIASDHQVAAGSATGSATGGSDSDAVSGNGGGGSRGG
jgi:hypothetical protein